MNERAMQERIAGWYAVHPRGDKLDLAPTDTGPAVYAQSEALARRIAAAFWPTTGEVRPVKAIATPAASEDVRERVVAIVRGAMDYAADGGRITEPEDYADRILALLRTPRGEGEPVAYMVTASRYSGGGVEWVRDWLFRGPAECEEHVRWLHRPQSRWQDVRVTPLYAARRGEGGGE